VITITSLIIFLLLCCCCYIFFVYFQTEGTQCPATQQNLWGLKMDDAGYPAVCITVAARRKGWVAKGRLKFKKVKGQNKSAIQNIRYPHHRKVCMFFVCSLFITLICLLFVMCVQEFPTAQQAQEFANRWVHAKLFPKRRQVVPSKERAHDNNRLGLGIARVRVRVTVMMSNGTYTH
jgi:hypothetical protein